MTFVDQKKFSYFKGFFARLMIRMMHYTEFVHSYWKNGAIMTREHNSEFIFIHLENYTTIRFSIFSPKEYPVNSGK